MGNAKTLFENGFQAFKVRAVLWLMMAAGLLALYAALQIFQTYGLSPGDGGVLRPFGERLAIAGVVTALGLVFAGAMMLYASLYVLSVKRDDDNVTVETLNAWGVGSQQHGFNVADIGAAKYHHGRLTMPRAAAGFVVAQSVYAPWITLKAPGHRLPFILDLQAETIDEDGLYEIAGEALDDWDDDSE